MSDAIDQFWLSMAGQYKEKNFVSITQGELNLDDIKSSDDKKEDKKKPDDKKYSTLIAQLKMSLGDKVKDIRVSRKLTDSPSCLVADKGDMDVAMESLMMQRDPEYKGAPRILEINPEHQLILNMNKLMDNKKNNELVNNAGMLLFEQARMMEGKLPNDPAQFAKVMNSFLVKSVN